MRAAVHQALAAYEREHAPAAGGVSGDPALTSAMLATAAVRTALGRLQRLRIAIDLRKGRYQLLPTTTAARQLQGALDALAEARVQVEELQRLLAEAEG